MQALHVAVVQRSLSLRKGGAERYGVNLCRGLRERGHRVTVVGESLDSELAGEFAFAPVNVDRRTSWAKNRSFAENAALVARNLDVDRVLGLGLVPDVDVVRVTGRIHAHWLPLRFGDGLRATFERWNPRFRTILDLERRTYGDLATARRIVVQSHLEQRLLTEHYGIDASRTLVAHNGVDRNLFRPRSRRDAVEVRERHGLAVDRPMIAFVAAREFKAKGLHGTLTALRRTERRDLALIVLGAGRMRTERTLVRRLGLQGRVVFAGWQRDVHRYYAASDLFVLPTVYEPFPNAVLESLACGTPAVTTRTCGAAEIVLPGVNGYLIDDAHDIESLAAAFDRHFATTAAHRRAMAERCVATANRLTIAANAIRVESALAEADEERHILPMPRLAPLATTRGRAA